ncbi:MAG: hypothetical protein CBC29_04075 [Methylococcaceae bacterium TMED69]|nr:MAG: hypothetical protein CBC29_04075 [Methylococcaceae bacterium TMED69]
MNSASKLLKSIENSVGKILVVMGGSSAEREISIQSGEAVHSSLCNSQLESCLYDWSGKELDFIQTVEFDICFIAVHGRGGEDGKLQAALEIHGKPFTGSGFMASAIAMHKYRTKQIWSFNGLTTPRSLLWQNNISQQFILDELGLPLMIKPAHEGSSVGVSLVLKEDDISPALQKAQKFDNEILIEQFIQGDEYTVSILGDHPLPSIKLETPRQFYDYHAKYSSEDTRYICPSGLSNIDELTISDIAIKAFKALGCDGWGRVDFIRNSSGEFFLIEVNTVPGMTNHSLVPMAALEVGISFDELVLRILSSSLEGLEHE